MPFQTQNSINNDYCSNTGGPGRWFRRKAGLGLKREPCGKTAAYVLQSAGNKPKTQLLRTDGRRQILFPFYLESEGASQMFRPFISTSTSAFLLGVDFIPQQMDGRIRSSPHYTPLLRSLWIQSTKSILLTSAPVHTWHFLQFSRQHQKHQLAARKWKGATDGVR